MIVKSTIVCKYGSIYFFERSISFARETARLNILLFRSLSQNVIGIIYYSMRQNNESIEQK